MSTQDVWADRLSDYLDDELMPSERAEVDAHLAGCAECSATLDALRRVVAAASSLPPRPPQRDLWPGVAARVQPPPRRVSLSVPQLVAASLLVATLSGAVVAYVLSMRGSVQSGAIAGSPAAPAVSVPGLQAPTDGGIVPAVSLADGPYDDAVAELERALESGRGRLDQATVSVIEQNLSIIDAALAEARSALAADPSNGYLGGYLLEARRRKLDLLRHATELADSN